MRGRLRRRWGRATGLGLTGVLAASLYVLGAPSPATSSTTTTTTVPTGTTTTTTIVTTTTTIPPSHVTHLRWPSEGSAAVAIPQLSVEAASTPQTVQPIASLTKLMTTWVALHLMPLTPGASGPCEEMTRADVRLYDRDVATGQSSVAVAQGERLCESQLLRGLFVHSAGNYAIYLVHLSGLPLGRFVGLMNRDARALGLTHTHYVEPTGIDPRDRSTAEDQLNLVLTLLANEPVLSPIIALTHVDLPVAGNVGSYTPYIGDYGVIGVKSGFTGPAGGCDVMLRRVEVKGHIVYTYAVVLGQHTSDPLGSAGNAALALSRSLVPSVGVLDAPDGASVTWIGSPADVVTTTTTTTTTSTTTTTVPPGTTTTSTSSTTTTLAP
ncbi:MAG TPA: hypothetical protein PLS29_08525 [Acidimicrobiales bacterium]|nr:MAG: hypothetical protein B7Z69_04905 [Actinobacteria bacterium 21-73-9]HQU27058.1 hypothetical protein [Acidimicrobiales bacterium]